MKNTPAGLGFQLGILSILSSVHACIASAGNLQPVALDDPGIVVQGTLFPSLHPDGLHLDRFDKTILESTNNVAKVNPERALNTSGVSLSLTSRAPLLRLTFSYNPEDPNRGSQFGIYRNGEWVRAVSTGKDQPELVIDLQGADGTGQPAHHEVVLPSWANPILQSLEITEGYTLEPGPDRKLPKIVFLGDSISHGTGQGSATYKNYPFIASRKLGMDGYNLAVGGGRISPPVADLLQHFGPVQVIWILVGYNNWQGRSEDVATIRQDYEALLTTVRRHQPDAEVFCCTLTYTRKEENANSGVTADEVRETVADVVYRRIEAGDAQLHLVRAERLTSEDDLPQTNDPVHFSEKGAARFADAVYRTVQPFRK